MKLSSQQVQTLSFFDRVSAEWRMKAEGKLPRVNVIAQRNTCVHRIQRATPGVRSMLDIGCGTGELVIEMAAKRRAGNRNRFCP
jgi:2-polyprenyl-3-methyl-5-hydroxy-6-metoxy-1,4-benzoquinol methylase